MRIIITGSCGFVGSHIARSLVKRDHTVVIVDDLSGSEKETVDDIACHKEFISCGDYQAMRKLCSEYKFDTLVHLAANAREGASQFQPVSVTERNLGAYIPVLTAALEYGANRIILFSSMATYGKGDLAPPFDEDLPTAPEDVYGVNKEAMEKITAILSDVHGYTYTILRPHNVAGEGQVLNDRFRNVIAIFMNLIMRGEPITIYGDGTQTRAFSYIHDSLPAFIEAIEHTEHVHGTAINVGGMRPITVNQLARTVIRAMGAPSNYPIVHLPDRPCEVKHAHTTWKKSEGLLNYFEAIGWEEGIYRMAGWALRKGPQEWRNTDPLELVNDLTPTPWLEFERQKEV